MSILKSLVDRTLVRAFGGRLDDLVARRAYYSSPPFMALDSNFPASNTMEDLTTTQTRALAIKSSWVYSNIQLVSNATAKMEWTVWDEETRDAADKPVEVQKHDWKDLMRRPNTFMSGEWIIKYTVMSLLMTGEAYWFLSPPIAGKGLAEIWPMPSPQMQPIPHGKEFIKGYKFKFHDGTTVVIPNDNICYFRTTNPFDMRRGLSVLMAAQMPMETDYYAALWNRQWFGKRNAIPTTIISIPQGTQKTDYERIKRELYEEFEERRAMITRAGDITIKNVSISHRDMDYLNGRHFTRGELDRIFGIPDGFWQGVGGDRSRAAERIFMELAVAPIASMIAAEVNAQIINRYYEPPKVFVEASGLIPRDRVLEIREFRTFVPIMTVDEARRERGLEAYHDPILGGTLVGMMHAGGGEMGNINVARFEQGGPGSDSEDGISTEGKSNTDDEAARKKGTKGDPTDVAYAIKSVVGGLDEERAIDTLQLKDWATYRRLALKAITKGNDPGDIDFDSDWIPADFLMPVRALLVGAASEAEVQAAFSGPFQVREQNWTVY